MVHGWDPATGVPAFDDSRNMLPEEVVREVLDWLQNHKRDPTVKPVLAVSVTGGGFRWVPGNPMPSIVKAEEWVFSYQRLSMYRTCNGKRVAVWYFHAAVSEQGHVLLGDPFSIKQLQK